MMARAPALEAATARPRPPRSVIATMYVCPTCKGPLANLACPRCHLEFQRVQGVPDFLTGAAPGSRPAIGAVYDAIYSAHENVWEDQGREMRFRRWFSALAAASGDGDLLEVGCGEGLLLAELKAARKAGIDPSVAALVRAAAGSGAECAAAQAEHLPYPDASFDVVVAVGVMEHYGDPDAATREILRVLRPGGAYLVLIHVRMTRMDRVRQKLREYVFPRPRPLALARWVWKKVYRPITQPMHRNYTLEGGRDCLARNGFAVTRTITLATDPGAPLAGRHVVVYVASKRP